MDYGLKILVAWSADEIELQLKNATMADKTSELRRISQVLDHAYGVLKSWAERNAGGVVERDSAHGKLEISADKLDELPAIRLQYSEAIHSPVSMGVGIKPSEAERALSVAKLRGGDQIVLWSDELQEELAQAQKKPDGAVDQLAQKYVKKSERLHKSDEEWDAMKRARHLATYHFMKEFPNEQLPSTLHPEYDTHPSTEHISALQDHYLDDPRRGDQIAPKVIAPKVIEDRGYNRSWDYSHFLPEESQAQGHRLTINTRYDPLKNHTQVGVTISSPEANLLAHTYWNEHYGVGSSDDIKWYGREPQPELRTAMLNAIEDNNLWRKAGRLAHDHISHLRYSNPVQKAESPALNQGVGAGVQGPSRPAQPSVAKPKLEGSEHSQGEAVRSLIENETPESPEKTHTNSDIEEMLHALAQQQAEQDQQQEKQVDPAQSTGVKAQVVQVLQQLKAQGPLLEQLAQSAPEVYQSILAMTQAVIVMARKLPKDTNEPQLTSVAEIDAAAGMQKAESKFRVEHLDLEHALPGSLPAEGYRLSIAHTPTTHVATVHRSGHFIGRVTVRGSHAEEHWEGGAPHRHGLRDAVLQVIKGHGQGWHEKDGWNEPLSSPRPITKAQPAIAQPLQPATQPQGANVTAPHSTYGEAAAAKPKGQKYEGGKNLRVRQRKDSANHNRTLMCQFSSDLLQTGPRTSADDYYDKLYQKRDGYHRGDDFWEVPQWAAHLAHSMPEADHYTIRDPEEAVKFFNEAGYKNIAFSALDVNKDHIKQIAKGYKGNIVVGGYGDLSGFEEHPNVKVHKSIKDFVESEGKVYQPGYDYRHFQGMKTIPRLTLSDGCLHKCTFCCVPKKVEEKPREEILAQADAFAKQLPSDLIYLNDKTFGQAPNHTMLPEIYDRVRAQNPNFKGFIVQTTAAQMKRMTPEFLRRAGIRHVELGIESVNDPILKAHKKPANEALINESAAKLRQAGVSLIPNIMIGLPGENEQTYAKTLGWLNQNRDILSHVNAYNLALYDDSELGQKLQSGSAADRDENQTEKSWMRDPGVHRRFHQNLFNLASGLLDKVPFAPDTVRKGEGTHHDVLQGGLADRHSPQDFDPDALREGVKVEMEHTKDPKIAMEIAMDHLTEDPEYYTKLRQVMGDHEDLEKKGLSFAPGVGNLPEVKAPHTRPHVILPVGSAKEPAPQATREVGKKKVQGADGKTKWREMRAGMILAPDGAPTSSRNPSGK